MSTRWLLRQRRRRRQPGSRPGGGGGGGEGARAGAREGGIRGPASLAAGRAPADSWLRGSGRRRRPGTCRDGGVTARTRPEPPGAGRGVGGYAGLPMRRVAGLGCQDQAVRGSARAPAAEAGARRRRALWVRSHGRTLAGLPLGLRGESRGDAGVNAELGPSGRTCRVTAPTPNSGRLCPLRPGRGRQIGGWEDECPLARPPPPCATVEAATPRGAGEARCGGSTGRSAHGLQQRSHDPRSYLFPRRWAA